MGMTITQSVSKKLNAASRERMLPMADLGFKIDQKWPKCALSGAVWVSRMCMEGLIRIGTNQDDQQAILLTLKLFCTTLVAQTKF